MSPVYGRCCVHPADVHDHYRRGTDCSMCECRRFRPVRFRRLRDAVFTTRLLAGLARDLR